MAEPPNDPGHRREGLLARVSKSWFSNYDERVALEVHCAACDGWTALDVPWRDLQPGSGGLALDAAARTSPFVLTRHARAVCRCGADLVLVLTGAAGGRQGEEQYGVAGLRTGCATFTQ